MKPHDRIKLLELEGIPTAEAWKIVKHERVKALLENSWRASNRDSGFRYLLQAVSELNR